MLKHNEKEYQKIKKIFPVTILGKNIKKIVKKYAAKYIKNSICYAS
jgi:hypothetical protein